MFQPNKKTNLNEGRNVTDGLFTYGGFPRILNEGKKLAKKDYDKDGKLETSEEEHRGAVDRAIKAKKGMMKEEFDEVDMNVIEDLLEELFDAEDMDLIIEAAEKKKWIQKAIKKEGSLRKTLKAKKGENIPEKKLEAAAKKGGKTGKRARLALTLKKLNEESEQVPHISKWIRGGRPGSSVLYPSQGLKDLYDALETEQQRPKGQKDVAKIQDIFAKIKAHPHNDEFINQGRETERLMRGGSMKGSLGG